MAVDTAQVNMTAAHVGIHTGSKRTILTDAATYTLKTVNGKVGQLVIADVGTSWTIDIYDALTAVAAKRIVGWVTADGKGPFAYQIPCATGITIVSGGTAGRAVIVWE